MGKINILNDAATAKLSLEFNGTSNTTVNAQHLSTITSDVQSQLDLKAPLASPTFTGAFTITGTFDQSNAPGTLSTGDAYLSTHAYATNQGDNRTHFGYNTGSGYSNYIRGAYTEFASTIGVNASATTGGQAVTLFYGGDIGLWNGANTLRADIWGDAGEYGMDTGAAYTWIQKLANKSQHCGYDRGWNNNPSITVCNNGEYGDQSYFRVHGAPGVSGGDYSVNFVCDGSVSGSDRRKKTNIQPITNALDKVKRLQGVSYSLVNSDLEIQEHMSDAPDGRKFGWIAQDAQQITPELTKEFEGPASIPKENGWCDGFAVDYQGGVPLLNEAIKEQQIIIEQLLARIEALENKL